MEAHARFMGLALEEAAAAGAAGDVPVGAVIVKDGCVVAVGRNMREENGDPTAHAELMAMQRAATALGTRRLAGCTLYVTLEPCPMCAGAILLARPDSVIFGAHDARSGCCGSVYRITEDSALGLGTVPAHGGVRAEECAAMLQSFFAQRREQT